MSSWERTGGWAHLVEHDGAHPPPPRHVQRTFSFDNDLCSFHLRVVFLILCLPSVFLMTLFHPSPASWGQCAYVLNRFSCVRLFAIPGTAAARLPCPGDSPGNILKWVANGLLQGFFPIHRSNAWLMSPALAGGFFTTSATWEAPLRSGRLHYFHFTDQNPEPGASLENLTRNLHPFRRRAQRSWKSFTTAVGWPESDLQSAGNQSPLSKPQSLCPYKISTKTLPHLQGPHIQRDQGFCQP